MVASIPACEQAPVSFCLPNIFLTLLQKNLIISIHGKKNTKPDLKKGAF